MIDRAIHTEPVTRDHDRQLALDERSMRVLELGLAGVALVAAILLTAIR
jgi:hypothetical protein